MKKSIAFLVLIITLTGCAKKTETKQDNPIPSIETSIAEILATRFLKSQHDNTKKNSHDVLQICEIESITDSSGEDALHIINFCENLGWVIVSADIRHEPILAYNTSGNFSHGDIPVGLAMWIEATLVSIEQIRIHDYSIPTSEIAWKTLIGNGGGLGDELDSIISIKYPDHYPPGGDPNEWPCEWLPWSHYQKGPLLNTTWGQLCTYNNNVPINCSANCSKAPTGCVATALAQIMQYWQHPSSQFSFSSMTLAHGNSDVQILMEDVGDKVNMSYACNESGDTSSDARKALDNNYGYFNPDLDSYDFQTVKQDMALERPVYLDGCEIQIATGRSWIEFWKPKFNHQDCHAWVCDGYKYDYKSCYTYRSNQQLHMNWGWHEVYPTSLIAVGPDYNGWYTYNNWAIPGVSNYRFAKDMIHDIKP